MHQANARSATADWFGAVIVSLVISLMLLILQAVMLWVHIEQLGIQERQLTMRVNELKATIDLMPGMIIPPAGCKCYPLCRCCQCSSDEN